MTEPGAEARRERPVDEGGRPRSGRALAAWAVVNLTLGYFAAFPLLFAVLSGQYLRAKLGGEVPAPFHATEAMVSAGVAVVLGGLVVALSASANRWLRRRLPRWPAVAFWAVTVALQLVPFTWFMLGTDRSFPALLGRGLLW